MGGKSGGGGEQVVGHKYYANLVVALGNPIEDVLAINFDGRGAQYGTRYIAQDDEQQYGVRVLYKLPQLFGKDEGGVEGYVNFYFGAPNQLPDLSYAYHLESNNKTPIAYQNFMSYAVFTGAGSGIPTAMRPYVKRFKKLGSYLSQAKSLVEKKGFYFGNSNTIRDMRYLVKRVNKRQDNREQWYPEKAEINLFNQTKWDYVQLPYHADPGTTNLTPPTSGWQTGGVLPFNDLNVWDRNPNLSVLWAKSTLDFVTGPGVVLTVGADNGCLLWVNGKYIGASNASNENIASNENFPVVYEVAETGRLEILVKAYTESTGNFQAGNFLNIEISGLQITDINPIHAIRELLTDFRAMGIPESEINDENFRRAVDRIYEEGLGVSFQLADKNIKEAIDEISAHIEGGVRVNRQTGLYEIVLFRDDWFDLDTVPHFTVSSMNNIEIQPVGGGVDDVNTLNIKYNDRELDQDISFPIYNAGARHNAGRENPSDVDLTYFKNKRNADLVGQWKLKIATLPAWQGEFRTSVYDARKINRYDVIKISPGVHGIEALPVRVMEIGLGDGASSNEVTLKFQEVTFFSNDDYAITLIEPPIVTDTSPTQADFIVHEITYWEAVKRFGQRTIDAQLLEDPDIGFLGVSAIRPKPSVMSAALHTDAGGGYVEHSTVFFCPSVTLDQDIGYTDNLFRVRDLQAFEEAIEGSIIRVDDELMVFVEYDEETELMRVKRGASPTIPKPHLKDAVFYFVDNATYTDGVEYLTGEIVNAKLQSITASSAQDLDTAQVKSLEIVGLANRPYPPANVQINGEYWPDEIETDLTITWVDRNRIQQTGGETLGWFEGGVVIEAGTTTQLTITQFDEGEIELETVSVNVSAASSYIYPMSAIEPDTRTIRVELKTIRDGYECAEAYVHTVELSQFFSAPYDLIVEFKDD